MKFLSNTADYFRRNLVVLTVSLCLVTPYFGTSQCRKQPEELDALSINPYTGSMHSPPRNLNGEYANVSLGSYKIANYPPILPCSILNKSNNNRECLKRFLRYVSERYEITGQNFETFRCPVCKVHYPADHFTKMIKREIRGLKGAEAVIRSKDEVLQLLVRASRVTNLIQPIECKLSVQKFSDIVDFIQAISDFRQFRVSLCLEFNGGNCIWPFDINNISIPKDISRIKEDPSGFDNDSLKKVKDCNIREISQIFSEYEQELSDDDKKILAAALIYAIGIDNIHKKDLEGLSENKIMKYLGYLKPDTIKQLHDKCLISEEIVKHNTSGLEHYENFAKKATKKFLEFEKYSSMETFTEDIGSILKNVECLSIHHHIEFTKEAPEIKLSKFIDFVKCGIQNKKMRVYYRRCLNKSIPAIFFPRYKIISDEPHIISSRETFFYHDKNGVNLDNMLQVFERHKFRRDREGNSMLLSILMFTALGYHETEPENVTLESRFAVVCLQYLNTPSIIGFVKNGVISAGSIREFYITRFKSFFKNSSIEGYIGKDPVIIGCSCRHIPPYQPLSDRLTEIDMIFMPVMTYLLAFGNTAEDDGKVFREIFLQIIQKLYEEISLIQEYGLANDVYHGFNRWLGSDTILKPYMKLLMSDPSAIRTFNEFRQALLDIIANEAHES